MTINTIAREQKLTSAPSKIKNSAQARVSISSATVGASDTRSPTAADTLAQQQKSRPGRWLVDVPITVFTEHSAWLANGNWQGNFDCALWLRTPAGLSHPVQLVLKFTDNSGEKTIPIDRCQPGNHRTVLLNNMITVSIHGRIRDASLYLSGESKAVIALEEWHITAQQKRARQGL